MNYPRALAPAVAAAALAVPGTAHAGSALGDTLADSTVGTVAKALNTLSGKADASCLASTAASKPFAQWGDRADYVEAPGGTFELGAGPSWSSAGAVSAVAENEPFKVSGRAGDQRSVVLGSGGSITSATMCAGLAYPTVRFFARAPKGSALALVTARYTGPDGILAALPLGVVSAKSSWSPTTLTLTGSGLPLLTGTTLSIRIAPIVGSFQVDDVYVDPMRRS